MTVLSTLLGAVPGDWKYSSYIVGAALTLLYVLNTIYSWYRLRHIPGPPSAGWSNWWLIRSHANGRTHLDLAEVCERYGKLARIAPTVLVTSDPNVLRRMLGVRSPYSRADYYKGFRFDPTKDNLLSQTDTFKHGITRAKMAAGYAGKENDCMEQTIDDNVTALIKLIDSKYISTPTDYRPMDLARKAQYFTLDAISSLAFGKAFGDLEHDEDVHGYIKMLDEAGPIIILLTVLPLVRSLLQLPLFRDLLPSSKDKIGFGRVMGIAKEIASERFGRNKKVKRDMLGSFVAHGLTQDEAESEILLQLWAFCSHILVQADGNSLAGGDTTATAIRVIMLYITTSPRILSILLDEIAAFSLGKHISDAEARKMPYLQAIIREGLRIWPPVVGLSSKEAPKGGDVISGVFIPPRTHIGYAAFGVFRSKEIWGDDANEFQPERWLIDDKARLKEMDATWELVFGYGRWQCLGKNVAMMELNKVIVELLRNFKFQIMDPTKPWKSACLGVFVQSEMWMRVTRREKKL